MMNFIEAWKSMNVGQSASRLSRPNIKLWKRESLFDSIRDKLGCLDADEHLLATDWEIDNLWGQPIICKKCGAKYE